MKPNKRTKLRKQEKPAAPAKVPVATTKKAGPGERTDPERRHIVGVGLSNDTETFDRAIARTLTKPWIGAAATMQTWDKGYEVNALAVELAEQIALVHSGDLKRAESLLVSQAHTLDMIFNRLASRSYANIEGGFVDAAETFLRLALKAQSQCRGTLETLAEIKNPMMGAYVRQANIASGHQQVNNGPARAEIESKPTKLLEAIDGERLDTGAAGAAGGTNKDLATVGAVNRAEDSDGQGARSA